MIWSVVAWGNIDEGGDSSAVALALDGTNDVISIRSTNAAFAAIHADGTVTTWGDPSYGGDSSYVDFDGVLDDLSVVGIYPSERAFAAVLSNGSW